jgi:hypothetical protein
MTRHLSILSVSVQLDGALIIPKEPAGVALLAQGSGSVAESAQALADGADYTPRRRESAGERQQNSLCALRPQQLRAGPDELFERPAPREAHNFGRSMLVRARLGLVR